MALAVRTAATPRVAAARPARRSLVVKAAAVSSDVPDMGKRQAMNLILLGGISLPVGALALPYAVFFVPPRYSYSDIRLYMY